MSGGHLLHRLKRPLGTRDYRGVRWDRKAINLQVKLQALWRFEAGEKLSRIGKALGLSTSTLATIRDKEKIWASSQAATKLRRSHSLMIENMEQLLSVWMEDQSQRNVQVSVVLIQEKVHGPFKNLKQRQGKGA
ncbi:PREDICTED: CENPB DNA-binding domain-containing protein 1-like [Colobus angolensis palliatus]|uniref:CENPB DNA-binding domain-containing protein 1-like n=1 Tax=Colobus angolensis palliatus TaxID=336983 RepID=UPI0005F37CB9|nr:PREDICTED: CENPB DNA-binding domain-containing protein 1-like [Colobus angolensis palliatus]XP_011814516.1 PREDICTED: CENPB DNA-binding domain-containing protein 1-like [Colobus angolensis palliatus]XP_011814518.1 PREDICTED: CENPB DNA-binding domain-containing protein 1-like [Colobus angolensis palliatus]